MSWGFIMLGPQNYLFFVPWFFLDNWTLHNKCGCPSVPNGSNIRPLQHLYAPQAVHLHYTTTHPHTNPQRDPYQSLPSAGNPVQCIYKASSGPADLHSARQVGVRRSSRLPFIVFLLQFTRATQQFPQFSFCVMKRSRSSTHTDPRLAAI